MGRSLGLGEGVGELKESNRENLGHGQARMDAPGPQNPWDIWESERHFPAQLQIHKA